MQNLEPRTSRCSRIGLAKALVAVAVVAFVIGSSVWVTIDAKGQAGPSSPSARVDAETAVPAVPGTVGPNQSVSGFPSEEEVKRWVADAQTKVSWSPVLEFDPKRVYMQTRGFPNFSDYYSSAYQVNAELINDTGYSLQLGETVFIFEVARGDALFAAGCEQRDGVLDAVHVQNIEQRYGLDGHDWRERDGSRRQSPLVGGSYSSMGAVDDGMYRRFSLAMLAQEVSGSLYDGYGYGAVPSGSKKQISTRVLFGRNIKRQVLDRVLVVSPAIAPDVEKQFPRVRLLTRFTARDPTATEGEQAAKETAETAKTEAQIAPPDLDTPATEVIVMDLPTLTAILNDAGRSPTEHLLAVNWLAELRQPEAASILRGILDSTHRPAMQRTVAAWGLAQVSDRDSIPTLVRILREEQAHNPLLSAYCAMALAEMGAREAVPELAQALAQRPLIHAKLFISAARIMADADLAKALLAILTDNQDDALKDERGLAAAAAAACASPEVIAEFERIAHEAEKCEGPPSYAIVRLGDIDRPDALDALIRLANSARPAAPRAMAELATWPGPLEDITFAFEDSHTRSSQPPTPFVPSAKAVDALHALAQRADMPVDGLVAAIGAIGRMKLPQSRFTLEQLLSHENAKVCRAALVALSALPPAASPAHIGPCLRDDDESVVSAAVELVAKWNLRDQSEVLMEVLKRPEKQSWGPRQDAAKALGTLGEQAAVPQLLQLVTDQNDHVAECAALALATLRVSEAVAPIRTRLGQELQKAGSYYSAFAQVGPRALAEIGTAEAKQALLEYVSLVRNSKSAHRIVKPLKSLGQLSGDDVLACLMDELQNPCHGHESVAAAIEALGAMNASIALPDILTHAEKHKGWSDVLVATCHAIEQFSAKDQVPWLCSHLRHENEKVRSAAAHALGVLLDPAGLEPLVEALPRGDARQLASILGKMKDPRALPALRKEMRVYANDDETHRAIREAITAIQAD
ncbi:MAG: hypothetical protein GMKNLPBB_01415 [Myxococcota bacterium]|nr:hypothetical protein [Myxococcota bacterium]